MMAKRLFVKTAGGLMDALLYSMAVELGGVALPFQEGDLLKGDGVAYPLLRQASLPLAVHLTGSLMTTLHGYNDSLKAGTAVIIGSSHAVSQGLSGQDTMQYKLQLLFPNLTFHNLGVPGYYSNNWLPTELGGDPAHNIDAANAFNPDIIILVGPTNDAQYNTPEQATANLLTIAAAAKGKFFVHSPLRRGDYNQQQLDRLALENTLWTAAWPYVLVPLWDVLADPFGPDFQSDHIHLSPQGTTKQAAAIAGVLNRELRPNTAYVQYEIERSVSGTTEWALFDVINDQQIIKKTYAKQTGYYRARALLKDGLYTVYSNLVQITNLSPIANAGPDNNLAGGTPSVVLNGSGSDPDGGIVSYLWTVQSGAGLSLVGATTPNVTVNGLANGQTYVLRLQVTDNNGGIGTDDVTVTVASSGNQNPVANAGPDQDLDFGSTTVNLVGSGTDPDGTITGYSWSLVSGPNTPSINTPNAQNTAVTGLMGGVYVFRLTVTDNSGGTATDDVRIRVVSKIARFMLSKGPITPPAGWNGYTTPAGSFDPVTGAPSLTDPVTGITFRSRGETNWNHTIGPSNAQDGWGQSVNLGAGFFQGWPPAVFGNYWYNPFDNFTPGKYQTEFAGLDPNKDGRIKATGSRSNANGATGPFSARYNINWFAGNVQLEILATFQNTASGIISTGRPLPDGTVPLSINIGATGSVAHLNAVTYEEF